MKSQKSGSSTQKLTNQLTTKPEGQSKQSIRNYGSFKQQSELDVQNKINQELNLPIPEQWNEISKILQENASLRDEIEVEDRNSNIKDAQFGQKMEKLQEECSSFAKRIEIENSKMEDNQKEISSLQNQILEKRKLLENSDGTELPHILKQIKSYELRLDQIRISLNESLAEIKQLKEDCNQKRRERVIFDNVFKKLEQDLQKKEMELKEQLAQTLQAEKNYNFAKDEFKKLKKQAEIEIKNFSEQYQKVFAMENQQQAQNFLDINGSGLLEQEQEDSPTTLKKKVNQKKTLLNQEQQLQDEKQMNEEIAIIFEKLQVEGNCNSVEEFIEQFINIKQQNIELYEQINKLAEQIENLEKQTAEMQEEMAKSQYGKQIPQQEDEIQNLYLQNLKEQDKEIEAKTRQTEQENQQLLGSITQIIDQLPDLINDIGVYIDYKPPMEDQVRIENYELSKCEKKINEIIELQNFVEKKDYQKFVIKKNSADSKTKESEQPTENREIPQTLLNLLSNAKKNVESEKIKTDEEFKSEGQTKITDFAGQEQKNRKKT